MIRKKKFTFGIIGCGNIGNAIVEGLIKHASISPEQICISEIDTSKVKALKKRYGVSILSNKDLVTNSKFIIIAVKPKDIPGLCTNISSFLDRNSIILSVAAGITIDSIRRMLGKNIPIIRFMPNLGIGYGKGLIGYCSKGVSKKILNDILKTFSKTGFCFSVKESEMFFITAVGGSGPGFLFYIAEIIYNLLRARGFSKQIATKVVSGLFEGTGVMLAKSKQKPSTLKEKVCSPGGTTLAGLSKMIEGNISRIINDTFGSAEKRAIELSKQK
ncbi:MAG: pyrroline-5-carboxylate reductase [bacterium]|nr:pyrroline-5-carboxylate reductase [bacterium]